VMANDDVHSCRQEMKQGDVVDSYRQSVSVDHANRISTLHRQAQRRPSCFVYKILRAQF